MKIGQGSDSSMDLYSRNWQRSAQSRQPPADLHKILQPLKVDRGMNYPLRVSYPLKSGRRMERPNRAAMPHRRDPGDSSLNRRDSRRVISRKSEFEIGKSGYKAFQQGFSSVLICARIILD
jgi:hypothetical protein